MTNYLTYNILFNQAKNKEIEDEQIKQIQKTAYRKKKKAPIFSVLELLKS